MWIFKCVLVTNFVLSLALAHPVDNDLSTENEKSIKDSSPPMEFPQNDSKFPVVDTNATILNELSGNNSVVTGEPEVEKATTEDIEAIQSKDNPKQVEIEKDTQVIPKNIDSEPNQSKDDPKPEKIKNEETKPISKNQELDESKIDTEVPDLLKIDPDLIEPPVEPEHNDIIDANNDSNSENSPAQAHVIHEIVNEEPINSVISTSTEDFPKAEVEWIQNGHDNEDIRLVADDDILAPSSDYIREAYSEHGRGVPCVCLVQGRYAAILAGVFIVMAVVAYALMLTWRRHLENRYGNRQMLINEEDDLKHFSL